MKTAPNHHQTLPEYIHMIGDAAAAQLFGVSSRATMAWRLRERYPRPPVAARIVEVTEGRVTYEGIYRIDEGIRR